MDSLNLMKSKSLGLRSFKCSAIADLSVQIALHPCGWREDLEFRLGTYDSALMLLPYLIEQVVHAQHSLYFESD